MQGIHLASKQSIMERTISNFLLRGQEAAKKSASQDHKYVRTAPAPSMTASTSRCYVPDGEIDKVGIDKYTIGRTKLSVVLKEKSTNCLLHLLWLGPFLDDGLLFLLFLFQVCTNAGILGANNLFGDGKFTLLFCFPHLSDCASGILAETSRMLENASTPATIKEPTDESHGSVG
jgi:hypothetical protein